MSNSPGDDELEEALSSLSQSEYALLLPTIRQIVAENLRRGRAQKGQNRHRSLTAYVQLVAQTVRSELAQTQLLEANDDQAWIKLHRTLRLRAYLQLLKLGVDHYEAYDRANDLAQDACAAILAGQYPSDVPHAAWAQRILRNLVLQQLFRSSDLLDNRHITILSLPSERNGNDQEPVDSLASEVLERVDQRQMLERALRHLPSEAQREVLRSDLEGLSDEEIAAHTGRSVQAVYNLRHRAIHEIRRQGDSDANSLTPKG
jgi:RNA polymerase sigma factor (sigma-70 family)